MTSHSAIRLRGSSPVVGSSPLHPARVGPGRPVGGIAQLEPLEQVDGAPADLADVHVVEPADEDEVLASGQVAVDRGELAGQPDDPAKRARVAHDVVAGHGGPATVGREEGRQDPDRGRLAGSVRAEQAEDRALLDAQVDAGQGVHVAVRLGQAHRFDRQGHGSSVGRGRDGRSSYPEATDDRRPRHLGRPGPTPWVRAKRRQPARRTRPGARSP
jgi:hypothetical protein